MVRRKDSFWKYAKDLENGRFSCNFCKQDFSGGISRIKLHLSGVRGRDIQICLQVPEAIQLLAQAALRVIDTPTKRAISVATSNNGLEGESISGSSSLMPNLCKA
jgi:disease resistance protein RPS2